MGGRAGVVVDMGINLVARRSQFLVSIVTIPLVARNLSVVSFGHYSIAMAAYFFGSPLLDWGLPPSLGARVVGLDGPAARRLRTDFAQLRLLTLAAMLVLLALAVAAAPATPRYVALGLVAGALSSTDEEWLLVANGRFAAVGLCDWVGRAVFLAGVVVVLPHAHSATVPICGLIVGGAITTAVSWVFVGPPPVADRFDPGDVGRLATFGAPALLARSLVTGYGQGFVLIAAGIVSVPTVAAFAASDRIVRVAISVLDSVEIALFPRAAARGVAGRIDRPFVTRLAVLGFGLGVAGGAALFVSAGAVVSALYGARFTGSAHVLRVEALALPAASVAGMLMTNVVLVRQRPRLALLVTAGGILAAVGGVLTLHSRSGPTHLALCVVGGEVTAAFLAVVVAAGTTARRLPPARSFGSRNPWPGTTHLPPAPSSSDGDPSHELPPAPARGPLG